MLLIDNENITDPAINLALEEYCVRNLNMDNDYLLFYINRPSIIIGKHQNTVEEVNSEYVKSKGIYVVRRISGGGAVYHDEGNLNFSFMTRHSQGNIHNFKMFTEPVIQTLRLLGIEAELNGRNDITVNGRKISGNAQFTDTKSMFSHGTLLFNSNLAEIVNALNVKIDKIESKGIKSIHSRIANIKDFLNESITIEEFRLLLLKSIFGNFDETAVYKLTDRDWENIHKLSESKYQTWEWNYGRSPEFNIERINRFSFGQIDSKIFVKDGMIKNIKLYGDFLGHGDLSDIENKLKDIKYEEYNIQEALKEINLRNYLGEISIEEFSKYLSV